MVAAHGTAGLAVLQPQLGAMPVTDGLFAFELRGSISGFMASLPPTVMRQCTPEEQGELARLLVSEPKLFWRGVWRSMYDACCANLPSASMHDVLRWLDLLRDRCQDLAVVADDFRELRDVIVLVLDAAADKLAPPPVVGLGAAEELLRNCIVLRDRYGNRSITYEPSQAWLTCLAHHTTAKLSSASGDQLLGLMKQVHLTGWDLGPTWLSAWRGAMLPYISKGMLQARKIATLMLPLAEVAARCAASQPRPTAAPTSQAPLSSQPAAANQAAPASQEAVANQAAAASQAPTASQEAAISQAAAAASSTESGLATAAFLMAAVKQLAVGSPSQLPLHVLCDALSGLALDLQVLQQQFTGQAQTLTSPSYGRSVFNPRLPATIPREVLAAGRAVVGCSATRSLCQVLSEQMTHALSLHDEDDGGMWQMRQSVRDLHGLYWTALPRGMRALQQLGHHQPSINMMRSYTEGLPTLPHHSSAYVSPSELVAAMQVVAAHMAMSTGSSDEEGDLAGQAWLVEIEPRLHIPRLRRSCARGQFSDAHTLVELLQTYKTLGATSKKVLARAEQLLLEQPDAFNDAQVWQLVPLLKATQPQQSMMGRGGVWLGPGLAPPAVKPNPRKPSSSSRAGSEEQVSEEEQDMRAMQWGAVGQRLGRYLSCLPPAEQLALMTDLQRTREDSLY